jgi:hypothetical protein
VIGDIHHRSLSIENGPSFEGRSVRTGKAKGDVSQPGEAAPPPSGKKPANKTRQNGNGEKSGGSTGSVAGEAPNSQPPEAR